MRIVTILILSVVPYFLYIQQDQKIVDHKSHAENVSVCSKEAVATNIVFKSKDEGKSWQDISEGLPADLNSFAFLAIEKELFLSGTKGVFRKNISSKTETWEEERSLQKEVINFSAHNGGTMALISNGRLFQKLNGMGIWMPVFTEFKENTVRTVFSAKDGSIFLGGDNGIFKSSDYGKTWNHIMKDGGTNNIVESGGVLICTNTRGILRSTDGGENWDVVISEGGVGIAVEVIDGGFAAITYNTSSETRRIRTSTDGGLTWNAIDDGLPPSMLISSIKKVGNSFYCGHPKGIYRSEDQGKAWELIMPTIGEKVFNLSVSGDEIYAVLRDGGC